MKYLVIELQTAADSSVANIVTTFDTLPEAESKFHTILSFAAVSDIPMHTALILTPDGRVHKTQSYRHETEPNNN